MASPNWTERREQQIADRVDAAVAGESDDVDEPDPIEALRAQWLNQWPAKRVASGKGEPFIDLEVWEQCVGDVRDDPERIYVAIEDHGGFGGAIATVCVQPDGRYGLDGWVCDS